MKLLAVRKEPGHIPGSGFHYMLHPFMMQSEGEAAVFEQMGHTIIKVPPEQAIALLKQAREALNHQCQVAVLTEQALKERAEA